jgi:hypothetical protein
MNCMRIEKKSEKGERKNNKKKGRTVIRYKPLIRDDSKKGGREGYYKIYLKKGINQ